MDDFSAYWTAQQAYDPMVIGDTHVTPAPSALPTRRWRPQAERFAGRADHQFAEVLRIDRHPTTL